MSSGATLTGMALVAVGVFGAGAAIGLGFVEARAPERTVTVKGLAERDVEADLAIWTLSFVSTGDDLAQVQGDVARYEQIVRAFLERGGIEAASASVHSIDVQDRLAQLYQSGPVRSRFVVRKTLLVRSEDVDAVAERSQSLDELIRDGVVLSGDRGPHSLQPAYLFTGLTAIKPAMLAEATANARTAAEQFAADAEARVGEIVEARQGLFQILARDKAPQLDEPQERRKTVRVVSTLRFALE